MCLENNHPWEGANHPEVRSNFQAAYLASTPGDSFPPGLRFLLCGSIRRILLAPVPIRLNKLSAFLPLSINYATGENH